MLLALAIHDDHNLAAQSLGITRAAYTYRLYEARQAFYALWHEGERPSRLWAADRKADKNRGRGSVTAYIRQRSRQRQARSDRAAARPTT